MNRNWITIQLKVQACFVCRSFLDSAVNVLIGLLLLFLYTFLLWYSFGLLCYLLQIKNWYLTFNLLDIFFHRIPILRQGFHLIFKSSSFTSLVGQLLPESFIAIRAWIFRHLTWGRLSRHKVKGVALLILTWIFLLTATNLTSQASHGRSSSGKFLNKLYRSLFLYLIIL